MKKNYYSPEFELLSFQFTKVLAEEVVVSDPQIPSDGYDPGELE